uniref:Predicted protein n=1 Tax=Hordeum vulgare subsp. vulgare TaxID=112509 RepID=F2DCG4_HORVV|nr:predicted protein [Hordeum vulgare subsp. vulgare]
MNITNQFVHLFTECICKPDYHRSVLYGFRFSMSMRRSAMLQAEGRSGMQGAWNLVGNNSRCCASTNGGETDYYPSSFPILSPGRSGKSVLMTC